MFNKLVQEVDQLKEISRNIEYQFQQSVNTEFKKRQRVEVQSEDLLGMQIAVVVDTIDPLKQGRVRYFTPYLDENTTPLGGYPWAKPISCMGGFDDSGCVWVPPAGSKVVIFFHNGDRNSAYYFGTVWDRHRGQDGDHLTYWNNCPIPEYDCLWSGRRNGYNFGDNNGDQVMPPWNNESYNGYDTDSVTDFYNDPQQYNSITYPHIKGFKTEQKHYIKFVDGDPRCNRRYNRVEYCSGRGNGMIFKDDHLHPAGQYVFGQNADLAYCHDTGNPDLPKENPCCASDGGKPVPCFPKSCQPKLCPQKDVTNSSVDRKTVFANPFYKRREEMRLYQGSPTPQRNKCELEQSGVHLQSISGHQIVLDDKVNQPTGVPTWDRDFDFGCDDNFQGKMHMVSATGHVFQINDQEDVNFSKVRGQDNGMTMLTASGNFFEMNDHTLPDQACQQKIAGPRRGITMMSTSTHLFQMSDHRLEQSSPIRMKGGVAKKATKAGFKGYCLLRSGYGLQLLMKDDDRQDKTVNQVIQLMAPQKDNTKRGPHMLVMQEKASGPGTVMLRAGGVYFVSSYDDSMETVGNKDNPSNKFTAVTKSYVVDVKNTYFNHNGLTIYYSDSYIMLAAGKDCPLPPDASTAPQAQAAQGQAVAAAQGKPGSNAGASKGPCIYNVIVAKDPWVCPFTKYVHYGIKGGSNGIQLDSRSNRVFASSGPPPKGT
jgi:hypothetical protein